MIARASSDDSILARVIAPDEPSLSPPAAQSILALSFPAADRRRMRQLAAKARRGTLAAAEQEELESYLPYRVAHREALIAEEVFPTANQR